MLCWLLSVSFGQACADYAKENPILLVLLILLGVAFIGVGGFILYIFLMGKKNAPLAEEHIKNEPETTAEEGKPEQTEEGKPEATAEENKPEQAEEAKPEATAEEAKPETTAEEAKPEATAEEAKPETTVEEAKPETTVEENADDTNEQPEENAGEKPQA